MSKISSPVNDPRVLLARLAKLTSTLGGLDAVLTIAQYSSPLVVALILKLAALRRKPSGLVDLAKGWERAGGSIREARIVMRLLGTIPMLQWLLSLHPKPLESLVKLVTSGQPGLIMKSAKAIPTVQALSLIGYYVLENTTWLAKNGIVQLSPLTMGMAGLWSVRSWALYVFLEIYRLRTVYTALQQRTRTLKEASKPKVSVKEAEGYELQEPTSTVGDIVPSQEQQVAEMKQKAVELRKDWTTWKNAAMTQAGWAPLTIHWSVPGGLWASPLITSSIGMIAALGKWETQWSLTA